MAKKDIGRDHHIKPCSVARFMFQKEVGDILMEKREKPKKQDGIRKRVLEVYNKQGRMAAYQIFREYNKSFSEPIYSKGTFEMWIKEADKRSKGREEDDGR